MQIIVDTHVHIYPNYDLPTFFNSALKNLQSLSGNAQREDWLGVLCLTERAQERVFNLLKEGGVAVPGWRFSSSGELILAESGDGNRLLICPGYQVVTKERIEVLHLLALERVEDGRTLDETCGIDAGITVLPWSPGKWLFDRGRLVSAAIAEFGDRLFLGDIWLRSDLFGIPSQFPLGKERGVKLVAGSDPLPLPAEECRVGRYGSRFDWNLDWASPRSSLIEMFRTGTPITVGKRAGLVETFSTMVRQRVSKL